MARPRKSECSAADIRLANAFWLLLERHRLADITVGMVAEQAELNRGTFYYHFKSMDDLVDRVIENETLGTGSVMQNVFGLIAGSSTVDDLEMFVNRKTGKFALLIKQGGMDLFAAKIKHLVFATWEAILCDDGEELAPSTRLVIEYGTSGIIGIITHGAQHGTGGVPPEFFLSFVKNNSEFLVGQIGIAQGIPRDAVLDRINATLRVSSITSR